MPADPLAAPELVTDWMTTQLVTVNPDDELSLAAQMMLWGGFHHLPVADKGRLVGILSDRDLLRRPSSELVRNAMTTDVLTITADEEVGVAATLMAANSINCLPVVQERKLVGILTATDVLYGRGRQEQAPAVADEPTVGQIMKRSPVSVGPEDELVSVVISMLRENIRHAPVVNAEGRLVGLISDRDLRIAVGDPATFLSKEDVTGFEDLRAEHAMTNDPLTISADAPVHTLSGYFVDERIGALPVTDDDGKLIGIISYVDLLAFLLKG